MAVIRQLNALGSMRLDVPDVRGIESAVAHDFDVLAGYIMAGREPLVIRGFTISTSGTLGTRADLLELVTASALVFHSEASEAGTIFQVPSTQDSEVLSATNSRVVGAFASNTTNYVGIDLRRTADSSTSDTAKFIDADTELEVSQTVPKARILDYRVIITTHPFSSSLNVLPVAKVVTDSNNNVVSVTDARNMMFRLGNGGDSPNPLAPYTWTDSAREENTITYASGSTDNPFSGGDKEILSLKEWMDSLMYRLWELGGGEHWYSITARDNVKLIYGPLVSLTDNFVWDLGSDTLEWESLSVLFENSTVYINDIDDGDAELDADGKCLYIDLDRADDSTPLTPQVGTLVDLGSPTTPGSRFIIAWREDDEIHVRDRAYELGRSTPATTTTLGTVRLSGAPDTAAAPRVVTADDSSHLGIAAGLTRDGHFSVGSGALTLGAGTNDASVAIGKAGANTAVAGSASVAQTLTASPATAATGATPQNAVVINNGNIRFNTAVNPNGTVGFTNTLTPANICKAFCVVSPYHAPTAPIAAFNIASTANVSSGGHNVLRVTMTDGLIGSATVYTNEGSDLTLWPYVVNVQLVMAEGETTSNLTTRVEHVSGTQFYVHLLGGGSANIDEVNCGLLISVFGLQ